MDVGLWQAANNGAGRLRWFVYRDAPEIQDRYLWTSNDRLLRFASCEAAQRRADQLNRHP